MRNEREKRSWHFRIPPSIPPDWRDTMCPRYSWKNQRTPNLVAGGSRWSRVLAGTRWKRYLIFRACWDRFWSCVKGNDADNITDNGVEAFFLCQWRQWTHSCSLPKGRYRMQVLAWQGKFQCWGGICFQFVSKGQAWNKANNLWTFWVYWRAMGWVSKENA